MKTSKDTLAKDEIVTKSGRIFHPGNKGLLENIPPDIVQEMAIRKREEINRSKDNAKVEASPPCPQCQQP
jgi:hypothetical protein